jgi:UDP-N-acetylmuramoyl-tripeptide--D-alanyl-D-alanine ligase
VAFSGKNFDAHDFVAEAQAQGAVAAITERLLEGVSLPQLVVADSRAAFGELASAHRQSMSDLKVIGITGSSGKTTVKEMLGSILGSLAPTLITEGNLNNDLGVPMMLLRLKSEHRYAVLEMGANHRGEIAYTTNLAKPDIAAVLNIGTAHLGEFGSQEIIAHTKAEIYSGLQAQGTAVVPADTPYIEVLEAAASQYSLIKEGTGICISGVNQRAFVSSFDLSLAGSDETHTVNLSFSGEHNIQNALMAATLAHAAGVDLSSIASGLTAARPAKARLGVTELTGLTLIDDTYNANFEAALAAAKILAQAKNDDEGSEAIMVLGDIGELGDQSEQIHTNLGAELSKIKLSQLITLGTLTRFTSISAAKNALASRHFDSIEPLLDYLINQIKQTQTTQTTTVLVKGSRFMKMERVIHALTEHFGAPT